MGLPLPESSTVRFSGGAHGSLYWLLGAALPTTRIGIERFDIITAPKDPDWFIPARSQPKNQSYLAWQPFERHGRDLTPTTIVNQGQVPWCSRQQSYPRWPSELAAPALGLWTYRGPVPLALQAFSAPPDRRDRRQLVGTDHYLHVSDSTGHRIQVEK